MANYYRLAAKAVAEQFDGSQAGAEALVTAYPDIISIQQNEQKIYPIVKGKVTADPAETGVTVDIAYDQPKDKPMTVTIGVTAGATASGDVTISFFDQDPIIVAVEADDTADAVAALIAAKTYTGFTATVEDAVVTIVQVIVPQADAILSIIDTKGEILNAYATDYIAFIDNMGPDLIEVEVTQVWDETSFEKYFVEEA